MSSAEGARSKGGTVLRLVGTVVGHIAGALFGGFLIGPLVYELRNPQGDFGYEFEGLFEVLLFGGIAGLVGAMVGNVGGAVLAERAGWSERFPRRGARSALEGLGYVIGWIGTWLLVARLPWAGEAEPGLIVAVGFAILGFWLGNRVAAGLGPGSTRGASSPEA